MRRWLAAALCCLLLAPALSGRAEDSLEIYCIDPCGDCMGAAKPCADHCTVEDELYLRYSALLAQAGDGREIDLCNLRRAPERYEQLQERLAQTAPEGFDLPLALLGDAAFPADGTQDGAIAAYIASGGADYPGYEALRAEREALIESRPARSVLYFYSAYCEDCKKVSRWIDRAVPADVTVVRIDVGTQEGLLLERAVHARYAIPEDQYYVPLVIYGDDWLMGRESIFLSLPSRIQEHPDAQTPDAAQLLKEGEG